MNIVVARKKGPRTLVLGGKRGVWAVPFIKTGEGLKTTPLKKNWGS